MKLTLDMIAKDAVEKALDEITYEGKTIREWVEIIAKQQPCEDCISRQAVLDKKELVELEDGQSFYCINPEDVETLLPVTPQPCEDCVSREEAIRIAEQGQIQGYEWQFKKLCTLPSVKPSYNSIKTELEPCEDCVSREALKEKFRWLEKATKYGNEDAEQQHFSYSTMMMYEIKDEIDNVIDSLPSVKPQRPKGRWIEQTDKNKKLYGWFYCSECGAVLGRVDGANYCSECGAEMEGSNGE